MDAFRLYISQGRQLVFLFPVLLFSACNDVLDEVKPSSFLSIDDVAGTAEDLEKLLTGAYVRSDADLQILLPDWMGDHSEYIYFLRTDFIDISHHRVSPFSEVVSDIWQTKYRSVNQCNIVLEAIPGIEDPELTPERADRIKGEALFLRAFHHFGMVLLYGKPYDDTADADPGVPILLQSTAALDEIAFPSRSTVAEVYEQATGDLTDAAGLLPESNRRGRPSRLAATACLARIAFQQRDYQRASALAGEVLEGPFALVPEPRAFYENEGSAEEIWSVIFSRQSGETGDLNFFTRLEPPIARTIIDPGMTQRLFADIFTDKQRDALAGANLKAEDLRFTTLTDTVPARRAYATLKYADELGGDDAPLLRLAEFYLMRAEALARTGGLNAESIDLLNAIRKRAIRVKKADGQIDPEGEELITFRMEDFSSADELIEAIIRERRVEFVVEGNRFHDLMRLRRGVLDIPYGDHRLTWPIPQREIDANGNLVQNPGY